LKERIEAAVGFTWPKLEELSVVFAPAYCTVFKALFAVMRASKLRVPPKLTVRESEPLTVSVPGIWMELREAVP
jgi:hypothetical protein